MRLLELWFSSPFAAAVGWALLHSLWQGAIAALLLATVLAATSSPRIRYAAGCALLLAVFAAGAVTLLRLLPDTAHVSRNLAPPGYPAWRVPLVSSRTPSNLAMAALTPWLASGWLAGVWIFYLRHAAGWLALARLRRRGVCAAPRHWQAELTRLAAVLRVSRPVALLESALAEVPVVLGHFRPVILIPAGLLTGLAPGQLEAILLHELAHIRRYDYLVNVLQRLLEGLLFYHPGVWWISRVIRAEREACCDDVAVQFTGNAREYAAALAELESIRGSGRAPALAATGGNLVNRIHRLLYPAKPAGAWTALAAIVILTALTATALSAWQAAPTSGSLADKQRRDAEQASPYTKWLDEDVVYIIEDRERTAFVKLSTDAERDKFIEQFWLRRDPTPGTPANEFKEEHYRRLAYANTHFASSIPGWQTDRGHIYIVYGPPDQIHDHPHDRPIQVWTYRHVEGIGDNLTITFMDRTGNRDYRIVPGNAR